MVIGFEVHVPVSHVNCEDVLVRSGSLVFSIETFFLCLLLNPRCNYIHLAKALEVLRISLDDYLKKDTNFSLF